MSRKSSPTNSTLAGSRLSIWHARISGSGCGLLFVTWSGQISSAERSARPNCCMIGSAKRSGLLVTTPQISLDFSMSSSSSAMPSNSTLWIAQPLRYRSRNSRRSSSKPGDSGSIENVTATIARAPPEISSRICWSLIGARLRSARMAWQMAIKSGAVSSRVPSMSKRTARNFTGLLLAQGLDHVVDVDVAGQLVVLGQRVVGQADDVLDGQPGLTAPGAQFGRADEFLEVVGAARQQLHDVFGADDREQVGLGVTVDGGEEHLAAGLDHAEAGADHRGGVRHVFEHFQAGDHVELLGHFLGQGFGGDLAIFDIHPRFQLMQLGHGQRRFTHVDAHHGGAALGHGFAKNAAAATDVQHLLAGQVDALVNPVDPQRVDVVQGFELAFAVPPAVGQGFEFGDFGVVDVAHGGSSKSDKSVCRPWTQVQDWRYSRCPLMRWPQAMAVAVNCCSSMRVNCRLSSNCLPATQRCFTQSRPVAYISCETGS